MISGKLYSVITVICLALISMVLFGTERTNAQTTKRIGTFDSRAVAVVYYNSKYFKNPVESLMSEMKTAKEKGDKKAIAKIEREGSLRQVMMHEQGFGKGSINNIIDIVKDKMAFLAKSNEVLLRTVFFIMIDMVNSENYFCKFVFRFCVLNFVPRILGTFDALDKRTVRSVAQFTPVPSVRNNLARKPLPIFGILFVIARHFVFSSLRRGL